MVRSNPCRPVPPAPLPRRRPVRAGATALAGLVIALAVPIPALAAAVPWRSLEELTGGAEVIVLGTVETAEGAWSDDGRMIVTRVQVAVEKSLKGGPRATVVFEVPGGRVGDTMMVASGAPVFRAGERVALFLDRSRGPDETEEAARARPLGVAGWNLGRMIVRRDPATGRDLVQRSAGGASYVGRDGRPMSEPAGEGPVDLSRFLERIERALKTPPPGGGR